MTTKEKEIKEIEEKIYRDWLASQKQAERNRRLPFGSFLYLPEFDEWKKKNASYLEQELKKQNDQKLSKKKEEELRSQVLAKESQASYRRYLGWFYNEPQNKYQDPLKYHEWIQSDYYDLF